MSVEALRTVPGHLSAYLSCLSICLSVYLYVCMSIYLHAPTDVLSFCKSLSVYVCVCLCVYPFGFSSVYVYHYIRLSINFCQTVCLSLYCSFLSACSSDFEAPLRTVNPGAIAVTRPSFRCQSDDYHRLQMRR